MVSKFNYLIISLYDKHAPMITKRATKQPAPWINPQIRLLQKQRDSAYRRAKRTKVISDWYRYKHLRNKTKQQMRNAKIRYFYRTFTAQQSTKSLWSKVNQLGIGKEKTRTPVNIDLNVLNDFFVDIPVDQSGAREYVGELSAHPLPRPQQQFFFTQVTESDVLSAVMGVTSGAVGADKIPIKLIKNILPSIISIITAIFNKSLDSLTFPHQWKQAIVCPLQKTKSPKCPSDYRPISILPALSKCLERIVHRQIMSFLQNNNLLSPFQSGFRANHSTTTALLKITEDLRSAMDKRLVSILTLFDFSKAFDCVHHPLLLLKLSGLGFSRECVGWVGSYLSDRLQCVKAGGGESCWKATTRGVPQGSVLGPLLFSIYINDVTEVIKHSSYHLYADDLQIYSHFTVTNLPIAVTNTDVDIEAVVAWAFKHGLQLNESKTKTILIGNPRLLRKIDFANAPSPCLHNKHIKYCDKVKNLGLTLNTSLGWSDYTTETCKKIFSGIHTLKRFALYLPINMRLMLVQTLIFPHFHYCNTVVSDMTVGLSDRLQRAQNYCIRFIFQLNIRDHITPCYEQLSLLKLKDLRNFHILNSLYVIIHEKSPTYLSDRFLFISDISTRDTRRGASLLAIPQHRTAMVSRSFTVSACRLWNSLPDYLRTIETRARFRAELRGYLLRVSRG